MARFRVLQGKHYVGSGNDRKIFRPGDIVTSDVDLVKTFGTLKFERIDDSGQAVASVSPPVPTPPPPANRSQDQFDTMSVNELKAYAAEEEIDLGNATRKEDIIRSIRQSKVSLSAVRGFSS